MRANLLLTGTAIIVGLLVAEIILWVFCPVTRIPESNKRIVVNATSLPGLKKYITYDQNDFGFRSLSMRTEQKPANTVRIICLGHSTTQQPTQSTEDIWSSVLEKKLQERFRSAGMRIEVASRGIGGEGVKQNWSWAQDNLLSYQPDLVILLEGINDLWQGASQGKDVHRKRLRPDRDSAKPEDVLLRFSRIYRRLRIVRYQWALHQAIKKGTRLDWHSKNLPKFSMMRRKTPYVESPQPDPNQIAGFSANLTGFLGFLREAHVPVIVLGQPVLWKPEMSAEEMNALWLTLRTPNGWVRPSTRWLADEMTRYNDAQRRVAEAFQVPFIDLDKKLPKDLRYFFDDCHFTDLGNVALANAILPAVAAQVEEIIQRAQR